jgi:hypothetical protein
MKRVLLDHCVPRTVRRALASCEVKTTYEMGWSGLKNGELLRAAEAKLFDVFVTAGKNLMPGCDSIRGIPWPQAALEQNRLPSALAVSYGNSHLSTDFHRR